MRPFALLPVLVALTAPTSALYFSLSPVTATDALLPTPHHSLAFTISNPTAVYEQGGSAPANCCIDWSGCAAEAPTCWQSCTDSSTGGGSGYYARLPPGAYVGAGNFSVQVWQAYVYELANHNNATVSIAEGETEGFECERDGDGTVCALSRTAAVEETVDMYYGGATPVGAGICA